MSFVTRLEYPQRIRFNIFEPARKVLSPLCLMDDLRVADGLVQRGYPYCIYCTDPATQSGYTLGCAEM